MWALVLKYHYQKTSLKGNKEEIKTTVIGVKAENKIPLILLFSTTDRDSKLMKTIDFILTQPNACSSEFSSLSRIYK